MTNTKKDPHNIEIRSKVLNDILLISIGTYCENDQVYGSAEMDTENVAILEQFLKDKITHGEIRIIIDLSNVTNIYSYGMSILFNLFKNIQLRGGEFKIFNPSSTLMQTFEALHVTSVFEIYTNLAKAVASFGPKHIYS